MCCSQLSDAEIAKLKAKASGRGRGVSQLRRAMGTHFDAKKSLIIQPSLLAPEGKPMPAPGEEQDEEPEKEVAPRPARNTVTVSEACMESLLIPGCCRASARG